MPRLAIIADTHIPSRAAELPAWVTDELRLADTVVHAGDFDSVDAFEHIDDLAGRLVAVHGNADPDLGLPSVRILAVEGVTFVLTHGSGPLAGYRERVLATVREADPTAIGISGHTHEQADVTIDGIRLLNPGSATGAPPADAARMVRAHIDGPTVNIEPLSAP